ncbi:MAG TPA: hypothetical protein ENF26_05425, partial [Methanomicrobia archaeon]|nr:hypothetical protein [Methanomicrobia archaeon]HEX59568.1 hypothetical protein [Methanomicrobia archaeon]
MNRRAHSSITGKSDVEPAIVKLPESCDVGVSGVCVFRAAMPSAAAVTTTTITAAQTFFIRSH